MVKYDKLKTLERMRRGKKFSMLELIFLISDIKKDIQNEKEEHLKEGLVETLKYLEAAVKPSLKQLVNRK